MITKIITIQDVKDFAKQLTAEGVSFHPDDDFKEYKQYFLLGLIVIIYVWINGLTEVTIYMEKVNQTMFFILGFALNKNINITGEKV